MDSLAYSFNSIFAIRVSGKDSKRYLNSRLTNNINELAVSHSCFAAQLNPKGRTEGFFNVVCTNESEYILYNIDSEEETLASFSRYKVADQVNIETLNFKLTRIINPTNEFSTYLNPENKKNISAKIDDAYFCAYEEFNSKLSFIDILSESQLPEDLKILLNKSETIQQEASEWSSKRFNLGIPSYPQEMNSKFLFTEALQEQAISFTKGCYVGQEVMEMLDSRGKLNNKIVLAESSEKEIKIEAIQEVLNENQEKIGIVVSHLASDKTLCFIRIKASFAKLNEKVFIDSQAFHLRTC